MMTILITGDNMMKPERFEQAIENEFGRIFQIRQKKYTFEDTGFTIGPETKIPSGMCFEDPNLKMQYPDCDVSEFYGTPNSLAEEIKDVDILILHGAALPNRVLENANRLKYIISLRGGPVNVDIDAVKIRGIQFFNTDGKNAPAVAEFALGALLDFERGISLGSGRLGNSWWWVKGADSYESHEIAGKRFGFVGYGHIARDLRKMLTGFDVETCAYDPYVSDEVFAHDNVQRMSLEELVAVSDYVSLHARPTKGAPPLMNKEMIARMQKHAVLINTARGKLLDYQALKDALNEKKIRGAVLDVLGDEPFGFYQEMIAMDSTLITPHIAGQSVETCDRACKMTIGFLHQIIDSL